MLGLIAAALGAGALRTVAGIRGTRREGNRRRSLIYQAYDRGKQRLDLRQGDVRQSTAEGLVARGLAQSGDVTNGAAVVPNGGTSVSGAHSLGAQQMTDLAREQTLEQNEMLAQRDAAIGDVNASQRQGVLDAIAGGVSTGLSIYGAGKELGATKAISAGGDVARGVAGMSLPGVAGAASTSAIQRAMGAGNPANWFGGIVGTDPLNAPGSSWFVPHQAPADVPHEGAFIGAGQENVHFNAFGG